MPIPWRFWSFGFGRPFGFMCSNPWSLANRKAYLKWLENYKNELEFELEALKTEIEELKDELKKEN